MATIIQQRPVIDGRGDIAVHGRSGFAVPVQLFGSDGQARDLAEEALFFELGGYLRVTLEAGGEATTRIVQLTDLQVQALPLDTPLPFALRNETGAIPEVEWDGLLTVYGFEERPA